MGYHYFVVQVNTREHAQEVSDIFSEALPLAIAKSEARFDTKMYIVSSEHVLKSTHELLEDLIRDQSEQSD